MTENEPQDTDITDITATILDSALQADIQEWVHKMRAMIRLRVCLEVGAEYQELLLEADATIAHFMEEDYWRHDYTRAQRVRDAISEALHPTISANPEPEQGTEDFPDRKTVCTRQVCGEEWTTILNYLPETELQVGDIGWCWGCSARYRITEDGLELLAGF